MKLCRFLDAQNRARVGLVLEEAWVLDLTAEGIDRLSPLFEFAGLIEQLTGLAGKNLPCYKIEEVRLLPPVERQEVWAAGVTYLRSKTARIADSDFSASAYDRVFQAPRPELFFKSLPEKVVGAGDPVGIRKDARWNVPEPELALLINSAGQIAGYTIGNDMSARDIEGENLLYLPQAKIYSRSCALGPLVRVGVGEPEVRTWTMSLEIAREGQPVFQGETALSNLKRSLEELVGYLVRSQAFPQGAVLLTGTGIVPPDDFSLRPGDTIRIAVTGIGVLVNTVAEV